VKSKMKIEKCKISIKKKISPFTINN